MKKKNLGLKLAALLFACGSFGVVSNSAFVYAMERAAFAGMERVVVPRKRLAIVGVSNEKIEDRLKKLVQGQKLDFEESERFEILVRVFSYFLRNRCLKEFIKFVTTSLDRIGCYLDLDKSAIKEDDVEIAKLFDLTQLPFVVNCCLKAMEAEYFKLMKGDYDNPVPIEKYNRFILDNWIQCYSKEERDKAFKIALKVEFYEVLEWLMNSSVVGLYSFCIDDFSLHCADDLDGFDYVEYYEGGIKRRVDFEKNDKIDVRKLFKRENLIKRVFDAKNGKDFAKSEKEFNSFKCEISKIHEFLKDEDNVSGKMGVLFEKPLKEESFA